MSPDGTEQAFLLIPLLLLLHLFLLSSLSLLSTTALLQSSSRHGICHRSQAHDDGDAGHGEQQQQQQQLVQPQLFSLCVLRSYVPSPCSRDIDSVIAVSRQESGEGERRLARAETSCRCMNQMISRACLLSARVSLEQRDRAKRGRSAIRTKATLKRRSLCLPASAITASLL